MATTIVPTVGLAAIASAFLASGTHIAIGSGATAPSLASTTMSNQEDRNALSTSSTSGSTLTFEAFFSTSEPASTAIITEVGLFTALTDGTLLVHAQPTTNVTKTTNKTMLVTIIVTFANA